MAELSLEQDCRVVMALRMSPSDVSIRSSKAFSSFNEMFSDSQIIWTRLRIASTDNSLNRNFAQRDVIGSMILDM